MRTSYVDGISAVLDHDFGGGIQLKNSLHTTPTTSTTRTCIPAAPPHRGRHLAARCLQQQQRTHQHFQSDRCDHEIFGCGFEHTLLSGMELGHQSSDNLRNTDSSAVPLRSTCRSPTPYAVATSFRPNTTDANNHVTADIFALYAQDQIACPNNGS
jgi:catecholate siderophore receptor